MSDPLPSAQRGRRGSKTGRARPPPHSHALRFISKTRLPDFFDHRSLRSPASCVETFNKSVRKLHLGRWLGMGTKTTFEAVLAALLARDHEYPPDLEQKNMIRAEFLRGAATAFALCWRGEESSLCLEAAKGLRDQLKSPYGGPGAARR